MTDDLLELTRLAKRESATFSLTVEGEQIRVTWKQPGQSAETVSCYGDQYFVNGHNYPTGGVSTLLRRLMERLTYRQVGTNQRFIELLTDTQRARLIELLHELKELKTSVLHPARCEPRLASPRSCLHPHVWAEE